ncbi:MAG: hypothetical protein WCL08_03705 [Verrucomicrobiota bacterium]
MRSPAIIPVLLLALTLSPFTHGAEPDAKTALRPRPLPGAQTPAPAAEQTIFRSPFSTADKAPDSTKPLAPQVTHIGSIYRNRGPDRPMVATPPPALQIPQPKGGELPPLRPGQVRVITPLTTVDSSAAR